jgi:hypothetical protein
MLRKSKKKKKLTALLVYSGLYIHAMMWEDLIFFKMCKKCIGLRKFFGIDVLLLNLKI